MHTTLTDKQFLDRLQACILLRQQGYYTQASLLAKDLLDVRPDESAVWHQLGQINTVLGNEDAALHSFAVAMKLIRERGTIETHGAAFQTTCLGYAQSLMRFGRLEEAWPYWEAGRLDVSWGPTPTTEYWGGAFIGDTPRSLLVQSEGGYGDIFMFMRWLPLLKAVWGIERVGLSIFPALADFCDWSALGVYQVYRIGEDEIRFGAWERSTSIMSLPACFNVEGWGDIPDAIDNEIDLSYSCITEPRPSDTGGTFRLGFCWRAEENSSPIKTKSLSREDANEIVKRIQVAQPFSDYRPVLINPGPNQSGEYEDMGRNIEILSLSPANADLYNPAELTQPEDMIYEPDRMRTWRDTASYLCSMDFVLTVDTAVAHLCGLLGVPALVLVPRGGCWRWGTEDETVSHWYGPQLTLYRQPDVLSWSPESIVESMMQRINTNVNVR